MKKRNISNEIIQGMREAIEHLRGNKKIKVVIHKVKIPNKINVRAIRTNLNLTRTQMDSAFFKIFDCQINYNTLLEIIAGKDKDQLLHILDFVLT